MTAAAVPAAPTGSTDPGLLPPGFEVRLRPDLVRADGGAVLIGGSPTRALRLGDRARGLLDGDRLTVTGRASALLARRLLDGNLADPVLDAVPTPRGGLTVVVPVRDRADQLDRCLAALAGLPVVVVDDASRDPAAVAAVAARHGAALVPLPVNRGPAGARNAGLARVATPLVAFVDSDVVVAADALLRLARHCADPLVALVGPVVAGEPRRDRPRWFERYDAAASSLDLGRVGGLVRPGAAIGWLPSACLVGRVAHLGDGFAADLRVAEDVDLVWRLVERGLVVRYDPTERARHDVRGTVGGWLGRKFVYGTGGADLAARHGDRVAPAALTVLTAASAAAVLQRRRWSLPVAVATVALTTRRLARELPVERGATAVAARLSVRGLGWAVRQESALLLRHWWPLGLVGSALSPPVRRAVLGALVVDLWVFRRERPGVGLPTALVARRLDDLAYGAGLWWGALRRHSVACLRVRWHGERGVPRRRRGR
ncbi:mycofactocin biosynthesis glycosyltransferase MftF [Nocardioides sp. YIM 152588]|uniref:mycofactocin biosynthesis glycosyltransferase MftF n=1 Tax=Nocardioides sp. YIM 152588 TaxID=3158259 RepID=UPI0032E40A1E